MVDFAGHHRQRREKEKAGQIRPFPALSAEAREATRCHCSRTVQAVPEVSLCHFWSLGTIL
jgi:hypothetical protein